MNITGNTPLISIDSDERIWAKLETHNRTGSVKDRMIEYICDKALAANKITPGVTTLVPTSTSNLFNIEFLDTLSFGKNALA